MRVIASYISVGANDANGYQDEPEEALLAYAIDVANFKACCMKHGFAAMPTTPEVDEVIGGRRGSAQAVE